MKEYTIIHNHRGHEHVYTGTIESLIYTVFGYTLECGYSWQHHKGMRKVNTTPRTGKQLEKALNNSAYNLNHYYDTYTLVS